MEPMTMGSPSSPGIPMPPTQNPFLPAYLMGDTSFHSPSPRFRQPSHTSPQKSHLNRSFLFSSPAGSSSLNASVSCHSRSETKARETINSKVKDRTGAPPVQGLLESFNQTNTSYRSEDVNTTDCRTNVLESSYQTNLDTGTSAANQSKWFLNQSQRLPASPAQIDPFYTQGDSICAGDVLDETWVTIFGFPPNATSYILQEFSQYGKIIKHVIAPNGNWLHIHYSSKLQAKKALSRNGKVFGSSFMVGVSPCIDKSVMYSGDCENFTPNTSFLGTSLNTTNTADRSHIRPLAASFRSNTATENEVVRKANTPQKSSNVISKAMEYMFGW